LSTIFMLVMTNAGQVTIDAFLGGVAISVQI